jgi:hypothetical protein
MEVFKIRKSIKTGLATCVLGAALVGGHADLESDKMMGSGSEVYLVSESILRKTDPYSDTKIVSLIENDWLGVETKSFSEKTYEWLTEEIGPGQDSLIPVPTPQPCPRWACLLYLSGWATLSGYVAYQILKDDN